MQGQYIIFFFNDTATTEIYTLSLHDALPISTASTTSRALPTLRPKTRSMSVISDMDRVLGRNRSEEHTSELQSRQYLVCRLLLEKKKLYVFSIDLSAKYVGITGHHAKLHFPH